MPHPLFRRLAVVRWPGAVFAVTLAWLSGFLIGVSVALGLLGLGHLHPSVAAFLLGLTGVAGITLLATTLLPTES